MAIICKDYNLLFIMTPRTACTAIGDLLCKEYGGEYLPKEDILNSNGHIKLQKKHSTLGELINYGYITKEKANSMIKFATVRNPFDSLVSLYLKKRYKYKPLLQDPNSWVSRTPRYVKDIHYCQKHSFNQWVLRRSYRKIIKRLLGGNPSMFGAYMKGVDVILRYESISKDLESFFASNGIPTVGKIPEKNRTEERKKKDFKEYYTPFTKWAVGFAYNFDLKTYGYKF